jgi:tRNA nucleotidyltransferase (CCA-adding enzyme)
MNTFDDCETHLLNDKNPSDYFNKLYRTTEIFKAQFPYTLLGNLTKVPQSPKHHPEGSVWNHTMLVVDNAAERRHLSQNPKVFMWSALLHDLGKASTTKLTKGRITSYDHDKLGEVLAVKFLKEFTNEEDFINQVSKMVRWHMQILFVTKRLPFADIGRMASEVSISEIALLGLCDRLGRGNMTPEKKVEEEKSILSFLEKCTDYLNLSNQREVVTETLFL